MNSDTRNKLISKVIEDTESEMVEEFSAALEKIEALADKAKNESWKTKKPR